MKLELCLLAVLVLLAGCAKEEENNSRRESSLVTTKVINEPANADKGSILIYVDKDIAGTDEVTILAENAGATACRPLFTSVPGRENEEIKFGLNRWYRLSLPDGADLENVAARLASEGKISRVQYNVKMERVIDRQAKSYTPTASLKAASASPFNDPYLSSQWHYKNVGNNKPVPASVAGADIDVYDAWSLTAGDPSIIVAVLDEGVAYTHPDLAANMWTNSAGQHGYNFVTNSNKITWSSYYDTGHGTHVAGTIAAVNNNNTGVCGVAGGSGNNDGVKIMSCQVFAGNDGGETDMIANAVKYAADNGASIIQCSFGIDGGTFRSDNAYYRQSGAEVDAYNYFISSSRDNPINGGIGIFAAGNESATMSGYPGALEGLVSVTSFACDYRPAYYTNYGPGCNIAAPGGEYYTGGITKEEAAILSTMPLEISYDGYDGSGYGYMQGTSMACPHVSGVAALGLSYLKKLGKTCTPDEFKALLLTSVNDIDQYCTGSKMTNISKGNYLQIGALALSKYKGRMGTGAIDTWRLLMQIEGTPCLTAEVGVENKLSLESLFGESYATLKYTGVEISSSDSEKLNLETAPSVDATGNLVIFPRTSGSVKITVKAIAGGSTVGGGNNIGGMSISRTVSVLARGVKTSNGAWL